MLNECWDGCDEYCRYGQAHYSVTNVATNASFMGTLMVSDEIADRYCLEDGEYLLELVDTEMYANYRRHAKTVFQSMTYSWSMTLEGTSSKVVQVGEVQTEAPTLAPTSSVKPEDKSDDDSTPLNEQPGFIAGMVIMCIVIVAALGVGAW